MPKKMTPTLIAIIIASIVVVAAVATILIVSFMANTDNNNSPSKTIDTDQPTLSSPGTSYKTRTLESAKADAIQTGREITALVPSENVGEKFEPTESTTLFPCSTGGYSWPSRTYIKLKGKFNYDAFLDLVFDKWSKKDGWVVDRLTHSDKGKGLDIKGPDGSEYFVDLLSSGQELSVRLWSVCFDHEPMQPGETY